MGKVIRLPRDPHRETQLLLPWYAADRLDGGERTRVEAHLKTCARCRSELAAERRLGDEVAGLPLDADLGWAAMRRQIEAAEIRGPVRQGRRVLAATPWLGWTTAACAILALFGDVTLRHPVAPPPAYHTLSAPTAAPPIGNAIVVFRSGATMAAIADALGASDARVVDGPSGAGAYVLRIPAAERDAAIARLRRSKSIEMVEPIDVAGSP